MWVEEAHRHRRPYASGAMEDRLTRHDDCARMWLNCLIKSDNRILVVLVGSAVVQHSGLSSCQGLAPSGVSAATRGRREWLACR